MIGRMPSRYPLNKPDGPVTRRHAEPAIAVAFVVMAMLMGGGGTSAPLSELILELVAALAAAGWLLAGYRRGRVKKSRDRLVWSIAAMTLALPVLQLVPLPPALWQMLPARENELAALQLVGAETSWMPWSMTPSRTLASLLSILPALLAMVMVASLDRRGRRMVIAAIAGVAFASLVLGALQLSAGSSGAWRLYGNENQGYLNGFQANRNSQADILLFGIVALAALVESLRRELGEALAAAAIAFGSLLLVLGCLATASRTGIALLPISVLGAAAIWLRRRPGRRTLLGGGALAVAGAVGAVLLYNTNDRVSNALNRFSNLHDARENLWADTIYAISRNWPMGSGLGSFKPVFVANERLEFVGLFYPNAAHNDYLEFALEGGVVGLFLLLAISLLLAWMIFRALRDAPPDCRGHTIFATSVLIIVASHSVVDYPLRSMAIACIAGAAAGLLATLPRSTRNGGFRQGE